MHSQVISDIESLVGSYRKSTISELDGLMLLNRKDTKYIFPFDRFGEILNLLSNSYRILDIGGIRIFSYSNQYFDTDDFLLFNAHHNGKRNRFKVRHRHYLDTDAKYFEIKYKTNKKRTVKYRYRKPGLENEITKKGRILIRDLMDFNPELLTPKTFVKYQRITLIAIFGKEKVTFDFNLSFLNENCERKLTGLVIAEVKQATFSRDSEFMRVMHDHKIKRMRISKYCLGTLSTYQGMKYNNFKEKLLTINKICYGDNGKFKLPG